MVAGGTASTSLGRTRQNHGARTTSGYRHVVSYSADPGVNSTMNSAGSTIPNTFTTSYSGRRRKRGTGRKKSGLRKLKQVGRKLPRIKI